MIKTVLFDLDGTLLPMDQDVFTKEYFKRLVMKLAPLGYEPKELVNSIWAGTAAMVKNDGSRTNEQVFWDCATAILGQRVQRDKPVFDEYYRTEFQQLAEVCGYTPRAKKLIDRLKTEGYRLVLATNPIFPAVATESRIRWAGLLPEDFELYTTYENTGYCKPNPAYYQDILTRLALNPEECLMVGNDVEEDMVARTLGIRVFLLTDCLISRNNADLSSFDKGGFDDLDRFLAGEK